MTYLLTALLLTQIPEDTKGMITEPVHPAATQIHLNDDVPASFGNTAAAPDFRLEWDTAGTDRFMLWSTDCDGAGTDCAPLSIDTGTDDVVFTGSIYLPSGAQLMLDGGSNTGIREVSGDVMEFTVGNVAALQLSEATVDALIMGTSWILAPQSGGTDGNLIIADSTGTQGILINTATTNSWAILTDESGGNLTTAQAGLVLTGSGLRQLYTSGVGANLGFGTTSSSSTTATGYVQTTTGPNTNAGDYDTGDITHCSTGDTTTDGDTGDCIAQTGASGDGTGGDAGDHVWNVNGANLVMRILGATGVLEHFDYAGKGAKTTFHIGAAESVTFPGGGAASQVTVGSLIPDGSILDGITTRVTTADNGGACTGYTVGDGADIDLYGVAATETQGTTTTPASATATLANPQFGGPYEVTITGTGGNCIDMVVRITAHYRLLTADTTL